MSPHSFRVPFFVSMTAAALVGADALAAQEGADAYQTPAPELVSLVDAPRAPGVSLNPDRSLMLLTYRPSLPPIAEVAAPELRIAGLRINPRTNGPSRSRGASALAFMTLDGFEMPVTGLPDQPRLGGASWSPRGDRIAFTNTGEGGIELWTADAATAMARRIGDFHLNGAYSGTGLSWSPDGGSLYVKMVPAGRGDASAEQLVPTAPVIEESTGGAAPARTYQDLLANQHDEALFEYYATSQLARVDFHGDGTGGYEIHTLGEPALVRGASIAPDGEHLLVRTTERPYSYQVPASRFPTRIEVWNAATGQVLHTVAELPLLDAIPTSFGSVAEGPRSVSWRPDADATLVWVEAQDGGDASARADIRDRVFLQSAPFDSDPTVLADLPLRYGGIRWAEEGYALISESWFSTRQSRTYRVDTGGDTALPEMELVFDVSTEDRYNNPGTPVFRTNDRGRGVLVTDDGGSAIYLAGQGASPEGSRPFFRKHNLGTGETTELFRSSGDYYEGLVAPLGDGRIITRRESKTEPPNYYIRDLESGRLTAVTDFTHPYPQFAGIRKEALQYKRADGVPLSATLYLPADYDAEADGPLPAFVWAYPTEFKSAQAAGQRTDSPHRFTTLGYGGAVPYVVRGYAVIDNASMPVIGEGDAEPNDTFRQQLVDNAAAAIRAGVERGVVDPDRVAIGGHSYGAFMTGNLLAHSDLFRAGIARSGAYNRTLTPFGFQREERLFWEAPDLYAYMSPFMHADKVNEPILLIHGEDDNNSGTFPVQSQRFYAALKGLGATARLVMLPGESHGYVARESVLHVLWETDRWLEMHVKNARPTQTATDDM